MAQLEEWSLPTLEVCGSNPVIGKMYMEHLGTVNGLKEKKKEAGNGPFYKRLV